jgi:hypothetical protein
MYSGLHIKKTGGRCQCDNKHICGLDEKQITNEEIKKNNITSIIEYTNICIKSMDVASLYPFVMCMYNLSYYMAGNLNFTTTYKKNKLGIYFIDITQKLKKNEQVYYCDKTKEGNNWKVNNKKIENVIMTSIEYEEILKNKPHWDINIKYGIYTNEKIKGCELFNVIIPFLKEKTKQDYLKSINDKNYNCCMRETTKTICNSLSGKFLQQFKDVEYIIKNFDIICINLEETDKEKYLTEQLKKDKMLHVGLFIYSLSKIYMYKYVYGDIDEKKFVYTDTDSYKFLEKNEFNKWLNKYGNIKMKNLIFEEIYNDKEFGYEENTTIYYNNIGVKKIGQLEDEYEGKNFNKCIYNDKKEYIAYNTNNLTLKNSKIMFKGVCKQFIILNEDLILKDDNNNIKINVCFRKKNTKNEFININEYNKLNDDEKTAEGILINLDKLSNIDISKNNIAMGSDGGKYNNYHFKLDGFEVTSSNNFYSFNRRDYFLYVDSVELNVSESICKKIYNKLDKIFNSDRDHIKKDAKIQFEIRNKK